MFDWALRYFRKKRVYELPVPQLVTTALNRNSLDALVSRIESRRDISDIEAGTPDSQRYMTKMLSEEVEKQFSDERRPLVELVSNAIDAKHKLMREIIRLHYL